VVDAGQEIICDACNCLIETKNVWLWMEANQVDCNECLIKWFSNSEIENN